MKKHKKLKIFGIVLTIIVMFFVTINIIPPTKVMETNPFISTSGKPMLCAHRGGSLENPENTLKAYLSAVNDFEADILETDLWMTSDNHLILNHDESLNRTSDVEILLNSQEPYLISEHTLEDITKLNMGYKFVDKNGNKPYENLVSSDTLNREEIIHNNNLSVMEIADLFDAFYTSNPDMLYIVEIKNNGDLGFAAAEILHNLLTVQFPNLLNKVVIGTFNDDVEAHLKNNYPSLLRGASVAVATTFIATQLLKVNLFDSNEFACLQIPLRESLGSISLKLDKKSYIKRAHRRNIAVQYWTINDEKEMEKLIQLKCDAIMTDDIALLRTVLDRN